MKRMNKISLEAMESELQILESPQDILGGKVNYPPGSAFNPIIGTDCAFESVAYLNGNLTVGEVKQQYEATLSQRYRATGMNPVDAAERARYAMANSTGASMSTVTDLFNTYVGSSSTYDMGSFGCDRKIIEQQMAEFETAPMLATINTRNDNGEANHAVVVTDYSSGVFTFWDKQNNCSGTFEWEDLRYMVIGSGNM